MEVATIYLAVMYTESKIDWMVSRKQRLSVGFAKSRVLVDKGMVTNLYKYRPAGQIGVLQKEFCRLVWCVQLFTSYDVYVCVCVCVCIYVCVHASVCSYACACVLVCVSVRVCVCIHTCVRARARLCV